MFPRQKAFWHWQIVSIARACPGAAECDPIPGCSSIPFQNGRSPRPEQRRSAPDRSNFAKYSRSEPALSPHDECPVSRQVQPGNVESDQALALQCAANFGLNTEGALAEASAANLFLLRDGRLVTPPLADGALPGVMRALLMERCGAVERSISPDDLFAADGVFLSSSLGFRIVSEVDGKPVRRNDDRILECVDAARIE